MQLHIFSNRFYLLELNSILRKVNFIWQILFGKVSQMIFTLANFPNFHKLNFAKVSQIFTNFFYLANNIWQILANYFYRCEIWNFLTLSLKV